MKGIKNYSNSSKMTVCSKGVCLTTYGRQADELYRLLYLTVFVVAAIAIYKASK
jgi:hypothetical protein